MPALPSLREKIPRRQFYTDQIHKQHGLCSRSHNIGRKWTQKTRTAFSHFSYDVTDGYLLVCDLQGVSTTDKNGKDTLLLTDPAIHCAKHLRFGKTNLGSLGMKRFFKRHVCNKYCKALGLEMPSK